MAKAKVSFDIEGCKGCGNCVVVCPKNIIFLDTKHINSWGYAPANITNDDMEKCIACKSCGIMCPDLAITVERLDTEKLDNGGK